MFTREDGEALHPEAVTPLFRQAVKKAMPPAIRLHGLRHTHATLALQAGIQRDPSSHQTRWSSSGFWIERSVKPFTDSRSRPR
jgi:integrase